MATTYLTRTFGTATNRKKFTLSMWVKLSGRGSGNNNSLLVSGASGQNEGTIKISSDAILWNEYNVGIAGSEGILVSNQLLRDYSGWYHLVFAWDSTNATADDRMKIYLNGEQVTSFSSRTNPSLNYDAQINNNIVHNIGRQTWNSSGLFDGSMSHIHFCDGQAYQASDFGETDANGVWKIILEPSVTYGTNGFFILKDGNSVTDQSGNSNNWTVGGGTLTNTEDCPSNVFATLNLLVKSGNSLTNGSLTTTQNSGTNYQSNISTLAVTSGKWYAECKLSTVSGNYPGTGIVDISNLVAGSGDNTSYFGDTTNPLGVEIFCGGFYSKGNNVSSTLANTFSSGDIVGIALDLDSSPKNIKFYKNGTLITGTSITPLDPVGGYAFGNTMNIAGAGAVAQWNFGNGYFGTTAVASAGTNASGIGIFEYDVPTGYTALSTKGLNL